MFRANFTSYFQAKGLGAAVADIDWEGWLHTPGMPLVESKYDQTLRNACTVLKNRWIEWDPSTPNTFQKSDLDNLFSAQAQQFLQDLIEAGGLPLEKIKVMEKVYDMNNRQNSEIRFR